MSDTSSAPRWRDDSGSALLEAGLVLPFLIALMLGIYDFGRGYETLSTAQKSMQVATRYLSQLPKSAICGWGGTRAKNLAVYGNIAGTGNPLISNWTTSSLTVTVPTTATCANSTVTTIPIIEMTASVPYRPILMAAFGSTWTFAVKRQERWIGQ